MNIKKAILKVFSANFIQLISSLIVGFIVPAILSIEGYADLKTYTLYVSYIGFLHFGYIDGLYIKYGGKNYEDIDKRKLKGEHNLIIIFEIIVSIIFLIIGLLLKDMVLFLLSISILPIMIQTFYKNIYQATGNFDKYSKIIYIYTIVYAVFNVLLALVFKCENYIFYCLATFGAYLISVFISEIKFLRNYKKEKAVIDKKETLDIVKVGFFILLANLAVIGLFGIDKWFVKLFLTTEDFAYYSFAVSMLNIINVLVTSVSVTFYNYLFSNNKKENIEKLKKYLMALGGFASLGFFALSFIVNYFIEKYIPSLNIIAITFATFPYMVLIKALYVNLYKVNKNEKKYLKVVIVMLLISIVYNVIALLIFGTTTAIAFATILTLITWTIYSTYDLKNVTTTKQMYIYMFGLTIVFLLCSILCNWLIGGIFYLAFYLIWTFIMNKEVVLDIIDMSKKYLKKIKSKKAT